MPFEDRRDVIDRMRKGWRGAWIAVAFVLVLGTIARSAPGPKNDGPVHLTIDISWGDPALPALPTGMGQPETGVEFELSEGRVLGIQAHPDSAESAPDRPDAAWRLGSGLQGKARVRIEAPVSATLLVKAGDVTTRFLVQSVLEGPQRTATAVPIPVTVERPAFDTIEVHLGGDAEDDGIVAPGLQIPATIGFNVLLPEAAEVGVRYTAELRPARGGPLFWELGTHRDVVLSNPGRVPLIPLTIPMPRVEGTYVLEIRATWEPAIEGSRLARLLKRRHTALPATATRRVSLAVVGNKPAPPSNAPLTEAVVDSVDLARSRNFRAMASGRSSAMGGTGASWTIPEAALVEASRRDRLRGWFSKSGEAATLPTADASGLAWSAMALKVDHPGRPHRLVVTVANGPPVDLGVALVAAGTRPRLLLDAAASGAPTPDGGPPAVFSWTVWPDASEPVLVLVNRSMKSLARIASVELRELSSDPAPAALAEIHPEANRPLALYLASPSALDRFGGAVEGGPDDVFSLAKNLSGYLSYCGASSVVLSDDLSDRARRIMLEGQASEDSSGPDRLDLILRILARQGGSALLDVRYDGRLPGLPAASSPEALARGLVRVDRSGKADGPAYQPLHAEVRAAMKAKAAAAIAPRSSHPNLLGLLIRLGPGPTLPGAPDVGLDDATYTAFAHSAFPPDDLPRIPGQDAANANRFAARWEFLAGAGRKDWLDWRADQVALLYRDLAKTVASTSSGAVLAVSTPVLDEGPAGWEVRRADRLGLALRQAWWAVGLDLKKWPTEPGGPIVLRGSMLSTDDLGHDLSTSADLDATIASRPGRGMILGVEDPPQDNSEPLRMLARPLAPGSDGDEAFGHALAMYDARWIIVAGSSIAGQEDRLARFARVYRALPAAPETAPPIPRLDSGVALRSWVVGGKTYLSMANDTPYPLLLQSVLHAPADAAVDNLGRGQRLRRVDAPGGGSSLVIELPPFGVAAVRVGSPAARVDSIGPYLPPPSGRDLDTQFEKLSAKLDRLVQGGTLTAGLPNPGFEASGLKIVPVSDVRPRNSNPSPMGWTAEGEAGNIVDLDPTNPHSGRSSLRLDARAMPASAVSAMFPPPAGRSLILRAWLRADHADTPVKIWIESDASGRMFSRHMDWVVGADWTELRLQATDLPATGLDRIRLRLERTSAGPLWIDDIAVIGEGPQESSRRAQMILTAALHAYREKRYADFARLAGSHWTRQIETEPELITGQDRPVRTGSSATDLPSGRRLR